MKLKIGDRVINCLDNRKGTIFKISNAQDGAKFEGYPPLHGIEWDDGEKSFHASNIIKTFQQVRNEKIDKILKNNGN